MSIGLILNENGNNGVPVKIFTKDVEQKALNQLNIKGIVLTSEYDEPVAIYP